MLVEVGVGVGIGGVLACVGVGVGGAVVGVTAGTRVGIDVAMAAFVDVGVALALVASGVTVLPALAALPQAVSTSREMRPSVRSAPRYSDLSMNSIYCSFPHLPLMHHKDNAYDLRSRTAITDDQRSGIGSSSQVAGIAMQVKRYTTTCDECTSCACAIKREPGYL